MVGSLKKPNNGERAASGSGGGWLRRFRSPSAAAAPAGTPPSPGSRSPAPTRRSEAGSRGSPGPSSEDGSHHSSGKSTTTTLESRSSSISERAFNSTAVWNAAGFLGSLAHRRGRRLAETPVQKAIGIVRELMKEAPEQKEKCEQLMSLLTSRELLQPTFLSDNTLAQDREMRDWLGGNGMVEERKDVRTIEHRLSCKSSKSKLEPAPATGSPRKLRAAAEDAAPPVVSGRMPEWGLQLFDEPASGERELMLLTRAIFEDLGLTRMFLIPPHIMANFIRAVHAGYDNTKPFHNFQHAVFVLQGCYAMLHECAELSSMLTAADRLAICIAAIGHDIGHTGTSNAFLINSKDPLALQYNDQSVLENHHCASLFRILQLEECAILGALEVQDYKEVRRSIIGAVLATDMAKHFTDIGRFKNRLEAGKKFSVDDPIERQMLVEMTVSAAAHSPHTRWLCRPSSLTPQTTTPTVPHPLPSHRGPCGHAV